MHELSIVAALIDQAKQEVTRFPHRGRIVRLDLAVGQLAGVNCESLRFAYDLLAPKSPLGNAELRIHCPPVRLVCCDCGVEEEIETLVETCPKCQGVNVHISGGQELMLQSIEVED